MTETIKRCADCKWFTVNSGQFSCSYDPIMFDKVLGIYRKTYNFTDGDAVSCETQLKYNDRCGDNHNWYERLPENKIWYKEGMCMNPDSKYFKHIPEEFDAVNARRKEARRKREKRRNAFCLLVSVVCVGCVVLMLLLLKLFELW